MVAGMIKCTLCKLTTINCICGEVDAFFAAVRHLPLTKQVISLNEKAIVLNGNIIHTEFKEEKRYA